MSKKETVQLPLQVLSNSAEKILNDFGLDFSGEKLKDLNNALINSSKENGNKKPGQFAEFLLANTLTEEQVDILLKNLTVGETYFFRDEKLFTLMQGNEIKNLLNTKHLINVWSAGCASGEEPYSFAILFDKFFNGKTGVSFKIHASDINKHSIDKARKGLYREWSFRSTPAWVKKEYFTEIEKGIFKIKDSIKNEVQFSVVNLSLIEKLKNDPAEYDIIICRNVLIYFSKPLVKKLIETFHSKLNSSGIFITTASESININKNLFSKFIEGNNTIFIKSNYGVNFEIPNTKPPVSKKETQQRKIVNFKKNLTAKTNANKFDILKTYAEAVKEFETKNFNKSLKIFERIENEIETSKQKLKDENEFYFYLIKNYLKLGNLKQAIKFCESLLKKEKLDYRLHYLQGIILQENGEFEQAEEAFAKSIYLNNKFPLSYFELANLQMSSGKTSCKRNFQKTLKLLLELEPSEIITYSGGISVNELLSQITLLTD